jgi:uncharacterized protein
MNVDRRATPARRDTTPPTAVVEPARTLVLLAKEPVPGRVKTRLQAAVSAAQAATLAEACLRDTVSALARLGAERRLVALDGRPGPWLPPGFDVVPQPGGGLDRRLAAAFTAALPDRAAGPALLIGMDTPQLAAALGAIDFTDVDAVLGLTVDGGYWAIGLREARDDVFLGVPMSTASTGGAQLDRLQSLGLRVRLLPVLRDVDLPDDARLVAAAAPGTRFAAAWHAIEAEEAR